MSTKLNALLCCHFLVWFLSLVSGVDNRNKMMALNQTIVTFDPYVSILDKENRYRYKIPDLIPLVCLAATKFKRFFIPLSAKDLNLDHRTGMSLSPLAVAHKNLELNSTQQSKLEVWIGFIDNFTENSSETIFHRVLNISHEANKIFPKTVTSIFISDTFAQQLIKKALWGKIHLAFANETYKVAVLSYSPSCSFVQGTWLPMARFIRNQNDNKRVDCLECNPFRKCRQMNTPLNTNNNNNRIIVSIPDTYEQNYANMSQLIYVWKKLTDWSFNSKSTIIFSKAFDTPYESSVDGKTSGWWRLLEDHKYNSTQDYKFIEKQTIAADFDLQENQIDFDYLKQAKSFSREHVGVIFSVSNKKRSAITRYTEYDLAPVMKQITQQFSKILVVIDNDSILALQTLLFEQQTANIFLDKSKIELMVMLMPGLTINEELQVPIKKAAKNFNFDEDFVNNYILCFTGEDTRELAHVVKDVLLKGKEQSSYKFGYAYNVSVCQSFYTRSVDEQRLIKDTLLDDRSRIITFYFERDQETVKLGAERMFQQTVVELEYCKQFQQKQGVSHLSIIFVMLHYATESTFYEQPLQMQTYVRYWDMLTQWAGNNNTTLIMNNALDGARLFKTRNSLKPEVEIGWWRYRDGSLENDTPILLEAKDLWMDKRKDTLRVANLHLHSQNAKIGENVAPEALNTNQILLIVLVPILVCMVLILVAVFLIRKHNQENFISSMELNTFFNGLATFDEQTGEGYYKVPYNKNRFEINAASFRIDKRNLLGSGEFGKVCRGQILDSSGSQDVAIKMANPEKIRKTTITGLLSEIKVLAHIGQHDNITELLGANTSDLKRGKVFIFLEFCHLGSLQKYLQKQRRNIDENKEREHQRYVNTNTKSRLVSSELISKLYRWSREICSGMAHLAKKQVVHADLATRNVLLNVNEEAKICDFGLSRRMYNYTSYVKQQQEPLPWKWMAPESLKLLVFNEKTDIWAYGITLWEIYSLGDNPYPGLSFESNFVQTLQLGFRMSEPEFNNPDMYKIMQKCWDSNPDFRPTFSALLESFDFE